MRLSLTTKTKLYILTALLLVLLVPISFVYANAIGEFFYKSIVIGFFGWILGMAGSVLNYAMNTFVIGFGSEFNTTGMREMIDQMWAIVRDLFNLTFIFGLVYIGFKMILRTDDGQTRRWLINLILAALLVNFSLFITKFVIDFSNILAVEIINLGSLPNEYGDRVFPLTGGDNPRVELSDSIQDITGLNNTQSSEILKLINGESGSVAVDASFSVIFGTLMVYLVATFVYLSAAIMLIVRAAVLVVLMILSPFLFLGMVLPMFRKQSNKMWTMLFSRSFFAPIYLAFLYITLSVASTFMNTLRESGESNFALAFAGGAVENAETNNALAFGPFILIIVLLMMSLVVAKRLGSEGAGSALKIGGSIRRFGTRQVGSATIGMSARVGRNMVGGTASAVANSQTMKSIAANTGFVGRGAMSSMRYVADSSFDARAMMSKDVQKQVGKPKKGGFATRQKEEQKYHDDMVDFIGTRDTDTPEAQAEINRRYNAILDIKSKEFGNKNAAELGKEASDLKTKIYKEEAELRENIANGVITDKEAKKQRETIKTNKEVLAQTEKIHAEKEEIEKLEAEIADLQAKESSATDPVVATQYRDTRQKSEEKLSKTVESLEASIKGLTKDKEGAKAEEYAKNEFKYQDRADYFRALNYGAEAKKTIARVLTGKALYDLAISKGKKNQRAGAASGAATPSIAGVSAAVGTGATAGVLGAATGGAVFTGMAHSDELTMKGLAKKYGDTIERMAKQDKENKERKNFKKLMDEVSKDSGSGGSSGDASDSSDENN